MCSINKINSNPVGHTLFYRRTHTRCGVEVRTVVSCTVQGQVPVRRNLLPSFTSYVFPLKDKKHKPSARLKDSKPLPQIASTSADGPARHPIARAGVCATPPEGGLAWRKSDSGKGRTSLDYRYADRTKVEAPTAPTLPSAGGDELADVRTVEESRT